MKTLPNLRKFARGRPCLVRIPHVCDGGGETAVLAHIRRGGIGGMGLKPPDLCAVHACARCHDVIDGRAEWPVWAEDDDRESMILNALLRTLAAVTEAMEL